MRRVSAILLILCSSPIYAVPTAQQIAAQVRRNCEKINDYVCEITFTASGPQLYIGETVVKVYYKKPRSVYFEAKEGFAVLPKDMVFVGDPFAGVADRLSTAKVGSARLDGTDCYLLEFPAVSNESALEAKFWVDKKRRLVVRADMTSADAGYMSGDISYTKIARKFWLPSIIAIRGKVAMSREGPADFTAEIKFSDYTVNSGIAEKFFKTGGTGK